MPPAKEGYKTGAMDEDEPPLHNFETAVDRHEDRMFLLLATVTTRRKHADACCACPQRAQGQRAAPMELHAAAHAQLPGQLDGERRVNCAGCVVSRVGHHMACRARSRFSLIRLDKRACHVIRHRTLAPQSERCHGPLQHETAHDFEAC